MARRPEGPWYRKNLGWYVQIDGRQIRLLKAKKETKAGRKEAEQAYHRLMLLDGRSKPQEESPPLGELESLHAVSVAFLRHLVEQGRAPATVEWYSSHCNAILAKFGKLSTMSVLTPLAIRSWIEDEYAERDPRAVIVAAKSLTRFAVRHRGLIRDPLVGLSSPPTKRRAGNLTADQRKKIRKNVTGPFADLVLLLEHTGGRLHEIRTMEARHYDGRRQAIVFPPDEHKTGKRTRLPRVIPLTPEADALIRRLIVEHPEGPIVRNTRGQPWTRDAVRQAFDELRRNVSGLPLNLCATHYRHAMATQLAKGNLEIARQVLGHSDYRMLTAHYLGSQDVSALRDAVAAAQTGRQPNQAPQPPEAQASTPPDAPTPDDPSPAPAKRAGGKLAGGGRKSRRKES